MTENSVSQNRKLFDIGSLFRNSSIATFIVEIISVIVMIGAIAAFYLDEFIPGIAEDLRVLLLLVGSIITLMVFLIAFSFFLRFSRRISYAVIGPGIEIVDIDKPRVKTLVYMYALIVGLVGITGIYIWYLIHKYYLAPWAASYDSISLLVFSFALGAFFIALLIQIIIAIVGRTASKVIIEVLDTDDSEFLD
ncbi:hypothetical protein EU537_12535 [Candidatus Thorarchaeota archaeon]|nr:MAG: hypothetical protein EU537_12535 [Candidatus Thorarchaeota archaeon]